MDKQTILQLDRLNQNFYQGAAGSFNQTRQFAWQGWKKLVPDITALAQSQKEIKILDLGCGNGRFAEFLNEQGVIFSYLGVDSNAELLTEAEKKLKKIQQKCVLKKQNIIVDSLNEDLLSNVNEKFDLITAFGVLHHVPSFELRLKFFNQLGELLADDNSLLVITAWQFGADERFKSKKIKPEEVDIKPENLEENDFILDWQKNKKLARYSHFVDDEEVDELVENAIDLKMQKVFTADGKSGELNKYLIWRKRAY